MHILYHRLDTPRPLTDNTCVHAESRRRLPGTTRIAWITTAPQIQDRQIFMQF